MRSCFVTLLSSIDYLDGILCLNQALFDVSSSYPLFCVVSSDISSAVLPSLQFFDIEYEVENKIQYYDSGIKGDIRLSNTATKITIYNLNSSDKLIYIDGDTLKELPETDKIKGEFLQNGFDIMMDILERDSLEKQKDLSQLYDKDNYSRLINGNQYSNNLYIYYLI